MESELRSTFTELFLLTLIQSLEAATNPKGLNRQRGSYENVGHPPPDFLPDLQVWDKTYSPADFDSARRILNTHPRKCVLMSLRAGALLDPNSQATVNAFLDEFENVLLIVHSKPYDLVTKTMLLKIQDSLNSKRVVFQTEGISTSKMNADLGEESSVSRKGDSMVRRPTIASRGPPQKDPCSLLTIFLLLGMLAFFGRN